MTTATLATPKLAPKAPLNGTLIVLWWTAALAVLWYVLTGYSLPTPTEIGRAWVELVTRDGLIYELLFVSFRLSLEVMALSTVISVGLSYLTVDRVWCFPAIALSKLRFFGMAGLSIVFQRGFGAGHAMKVAMLTFIVSTFLTTSMIDVVGSATQQEYDHTRTLKMSRWRSVWEVVVRGKLDQTFDVLRQNASIGWMSLTMVESLAKFEGGVGVIMTNAEKYRSLAPIFAVQFTVMMVGIFQDQFFVWLKNLCCPHVKYVAGKR